MAANNYSIKKVAVLGAGVMGQGIAAHLANAGVPSVLYDIVPRDLPEGGDRSVTARQGIKKAQKLKPASFFTTDAASLITPANYDDDAALLSECDLIIEVVVEYLPVKKKVFSWVAEHRSATSIVASNTSGIPLADMVADMPADMRSHFLITHFFNPVRYMRLLEIVAGPDTDPAATAALAAFGEQKLGKGIVHAKDTPNFIGNRIGTFAIGAVARHMEKYDVAIEDVDAIFGAAMGRPKLGVFGLGDLVGLDTLVHVLANVYDGCPDDERRDDFKPAAWLTKMVEEGAHGNKVGKGFYQRTKERDAKGRRITLARNLKTGEYAPKKFPKHASVKKAKAFKSSPASAIRTLLKGDDVAAQLAWGVTADLLIYSANRIPEIADDIVNIDRAMRWGFNWDMGPFEGWDAIGVADSVERMKADGLDIPQWVADMLASGRTSFYARNAQGQQTYWDPTSGSAAVVEGSASWLSLTDVRAASGGIVDKNASAQLLDLGDGVLAFALTNPDAMNALNEDLFALYSKALDGLDAGQWEGLVICAQNSEYGAFRPSVGPNGNAFCAGANLMMIGMLAMQQKWDELGATIQGLQDLVTRAQYCSRPIVAAPFGLTLGGGLEVAMQTSAVQTTGEVFMGLVEAGMGLLPAGGGCKEMLKRHLGDIPKGVNYDPNPFVQSAFLNIGLAKVATSCEEAREMGYLRATDQVSMDADSLIHDAKQKVLGLAKGGYQAPRKSTFKLPGASGRSPIELRLYELNLGGYATDHDVVVAKRIAHVMTGGDIPSNTWVDEQHILDLEREGFLSLLGEAATLARIQHFLTTGKVLRN
ncbi:MAG: 3-hydroxyacyl-CoA dehydrogenase/enoyl-CoA hydratase family protein [Myxococcota bacterium]|nr:3-hydroxyacyl-CoA dehydrogenase/enoyl-CoA hydratase family protein [Myxococcota bacterium]